MVGNPTQRVLSLLALLQSRPVWSGPELAERLGVSTRSVRRDVERLRDLGYPVPAAHGIGGGYRLGAGRALPPLLLDDEETVAVAVALRLAAGGAIEGAAEPAMRVLTKLDQVLPPRLRTELRTLVEASEHLPGGPSVAGDALMTLARACRNRLRARFGYAARSGAPTSRRTEPVRLVAAGQRWYLFAWDLDREDWRSFRVDRMTEVEATSWQFVPRPHPDPVDYVQRAVTSAAYRHQATVRIMAPLAEISGLVSPLTARLEAITDHETELTAGTDDLGWLALHLARLGPAFEIVGPPELVELAEALGTRLVAAARPDEE